MAKYGNYDAATDTLPKHRKAVTAKTGPILERKTPEFCPCGCGEVAKGKNSTFRMGHDARMKGILLRAYVAQSPVTFKVDGGTLQTHKAINVADEFGWGDVIRNRAIDIKANGKVTKPKAAKNNGPQVGDTAKIRVGRWQYDAVVIGTDGKDVEYQYTTKSGKTGIARQAA